MENGHIETCGKSPSTIELSSENPSFNSNEEDEFQAAEKIEEIVKQLNLTTLNLRRLAGDKAHERDSFNCALAKILQKHVADIADLRRKGLRRDTAHQETETKLDDLRGENAKRLDVVLHENERRLEDLRLDTGKRLAEAFESMTGRLNAVYQHMQAVRVSHEASLAEMRSLTDACQVEMNAVVKTLWQNIRDSREEIAVLRDRIERLEGEEVD